MVAKKVSAKSAAEEEAPAMATPSDSPSSSTNNDWFKVKVNFKNPDFKHSAIHGQSKGTGKKKQWRTLKQILTTEQALDWPANRSPAAQKGSFDSKVVTYGSIDAPPSFKPAKKYSDVSGLPAVYTDPQTKLNYTVSEEFQIIRKMPSDIVAGYLTLRRANTQLQ